MREKRVDIKMGLPPTKSERFSNNVRRFFGGLFLKKDEALSHKEERKSNQNIVEFSKEVTLKLGNPLPPEYQEVLATIPESLPSEYRQKITESAYYFWSLETGKELFDEKGNSLNPKVQLLADQISSSGFILSQYGLAKQNLFGNNDFDPKRSWPAWVQKRVEENCRKGVEFTAEEERKIQEEYDQYISENADSTERTNRGTFSYYEEGVLVDHANKEITNHFKAYLEGAVLRDMASVKSVLLELKSKNLHPETSKLYEGTRLVLYWAGDLELDGQKIRDVFQNLDVEFRGMGQDTKRFKFDDKTNKIIIDNIDSNDGSLGERSSSYLWDEAEYFPKAFFKQYLRRVTYGTKDPTEPYRIGYILADERISSDFLEKFSQKEGVPFITAEETRMIHLE